MLCRSWRENEMKDSLKYRNIYTDEWNEHWYMKYISDDTLIYFADKCLVMIHWCTKYFKLILYFYDSNNFTFLIIVSVFDTF